MASLNKQREFFQQAPTSFEHRTFGLQWRQHNLYVMPHNNTKTEIQRSNSVYLKLNTISAGNHVFKFCGPNYEIQHIRLSWAALSMSKDKL